MYSENKPGVRWDLQVENSSRFMDETGIVKGFGIKEYIADPYERKLIPTRVLCLRMWAWIVIVLVHPAESFVRLTYYI